MTTCVSKVERNCWNQKKDLIVFFKIDLFLTWHTILKTQHSNYEPLQSQQDAMQRRMYTQTNNWRGSSLKN